MKGRWCFWLQLNKLKLGLNLKELLVEPFCKTVETGRNEPKHIRIKGLPGLKAFTRISRLRSPILNSSKMGNRVLATVSLNPVLKISKPNFFQESVPEFSAKRSNSSLEEVIVSSLYIF